LGDCEVMHLGEAASMDGPVPSAAKPRIPSWK
jgi:hypothetical protein